MGNYDKSENGHDEMGQPHSHANGERLLKPPTSPMSQQQQSRRNGSRSNGTHHVDASRLNSSGATLDLGCVTDAAIYTLSPDLSTEEVCKSEGCCLSRSLSPVRNLSEAESFCANGTFITFLTTWYLLSSCHFGLHCCSECEILGKQVIFKVTTPEIDI